MLPAGEVEEARTQLGWGLLLASWHCVCLSLHSCPKGDTEHAGLLQSEGGPSWEQRVTLRGSRAAQHSVCVEGSSTGWGSHSV